MKNLTTNELKNVLGGLTNLKCVNLDFVLPGTSVCAFSVVACTYDEGWDVEYSNC